MFTWVCALCNSPDDLWYVMTKKSPCDIPLIHGDIVCKRCSETLPKEVQDLLHWISRETRQKYLDSLRPSR